MRYYLPLETSNEPLPAGVSAREPAADAEHG